MHLFTCISHIYNKFPNTVLLYTKGSILSQPVTTQFASVLQENAALTNLGIDFMISIFQCERQMNRPATKVAVVLELRYRRIDFFQYPTW